MRFARLSLAVLTALFMASMASGASAMTVSELKQCVRKAVPTFAAYTSIEELRDGHAARVFDLLFYVQLSTQQGEEFRRLLAEYDDCADLDHNMKLHAETQRAEWRSAGWSSIKDPSDNIFFASIATKARLVKIFATQFAITDADAVAAGLSSSHTAILWYVVDAASAEKREIFDSKKEEDFYDEYDLAEYLDLEYIEDTLTANELNQLIINKYKKDMLNDIRAGLNK